MKTLPKATVIVDLQFGSTGKGLIAGYLAERDQPDVLMTAWSANAGHTYINKQGRKFVHCMLANGIVSPKLEAVLIGPGSQISLDLLLKEVMECADLLKGKKVYIHRNAAIIQQRHIDEEAGPLAMTKIGSTKKGCGAAMIEKIRRSPDSVIVAGQMVADIFEMFLPAREAGIDFAVTDDATYYSIVYGAHRIQVEGAQGFSLGINNGFYPYTTSRECTPAQVAVDVGLPLSFIKKVVGTMRTYPIRVANRYDEDGKQIGWSGPSYPDQKEITFEEIGQTTELTTVTKLPRRIFEFSEDQTWAALQVVRPDEVFLNFVNYADDVSPDGDLRYDIIKTIERVAAKLGIVQWNDFGYYVKYLGHGPYATDVQELDDIEGEIDSSKFLK